MLANDSDANGDELSLFSVDDPLPAGSTVVFPSGSTFAIGEAPDSAIFARNGAGNFSGSFDYEASDGQLLTGDTAVTVTASSGSTITGGGGNEILIAGGENDSLNGGGGDDFLVGGAGLDTMTGGGGSDTFYWTVDDLSTTTIILSTGGEAEYSIPGTNPTFEDGDLVESDPFDSATLFFDEDLFSDDEDIDAVHVLANGNIVLSTKGSATLGGLSFQDQDLVIYNPSGVSVGGIAAGTAQLLVDGSNLIVNESDVDEDIDAVHVLDNGNIVFSTKTRNSTSRAPTRPSMTKTWSSSIRAVVPSTDWPPVRCGYISMAARCSPMMKTSMRFTF